MKEFWVSLFINVHAFKYFVKFFPRVKKKKNDLLSTMKVLVYQQKKNDKTDVHGDKTSFLFVIFLPLIDGPKLYGNLVLC